MQQIKIRRSASDQPVWIDLGCGNSKQPGFVGIDRFPMPGVDIVCDIDHGLPLRSDSVDYLLASHSLEHLRDMPASIGEIFRICKDRAAVTIIAPYDATRLNHANPYHLQTWNEHTARFFTADNAPTIAPDDYRFPSAEHWGLQASDFTRSNVDMRCLRMEFTYLPPYRGLDERSKRTLRQSLSDVCDQMALHLLVVKSPITQDELTRRAASIQYPVPAAFEARRREETDTSTENLFTELARTPARIAALSAKANDEIALLGEEMRRVIERINHIDRALVAEKQESDRAISDLVGADRVLSERMTAVNSSMTRHVQAMKEELHETLAAERRTAQAAADRLRDSLAAELKSAHARFSEQVLLRLVAERRARLDHAFWPIRYLRRYHQRGLDLRSIAGGELARLWQGPETPPESGFRLQLGSFLVANDARAYPVKTVGSLLRGIEFGMAAAFPPAEPMAICDYELRDGQGMLLRNGTIVADPSCGSSPVSVQFEPVACAHGQTLIFRVRPLMGVEQIGVQLFEWHRISPLLRRVPEVRLAYRGRYEA